MGPSPLPFNFQASAKLLITKLKQILQYRTGTDPLTAYNIIRWDLFYSKILKAMLLLAWNKTKKTSTIAMTCINTQNEVEREIIGLIMPTV